MNKTYYSWECPPRIVDKEGVLNFKVDLNLIFNGNKIDQFTELPKVIEFKEIEKEYVENKYYKIIADSNAYFLSPKSLIKYGSLKDFFSKYKDRLQLLCDKEYGFGKVKVVLFTELIQEHLPLYFSLFLEYMNSFRSFVRDDQYEAIKKYLIEHVGKGDDDFVKKVVVSYIVEGIILPKVLENPVWINFDEPEILANMTNIVGKVEIVNRTELHQENFIKDFLLNKSMIKLFQFSTCPFCKKVRDFMDEHDIEYEIVEVDRNNKPEEVMSTGGTVPVIEHDGKIVSNSLVIIEYLKKNVLNE